MRAAILLIVGMTACAAAGAADLATIKARGYLVVAAPDGAPTFDGALLAQLGQAEGFEIRTIATPRAALVTAVIDGCADLAVGGVQIASDRENLIAFTRPLADATATYLVRHDDDRIHGITDLDGRPFGMPAGSGAFTGLAQLEFRLAKAGGRLGSPAEFATPADGTAALAEHKIDYLIEPAAVADALVQATPGQLARGEALSSPGYFAWALKSDNAELRALLGRFLDGEAKSGALADAQTAAFGRTYPDLPTSWDGHDWWYARKDRPIHFPVPGNGEPD